MADSDFYICKACVEGYHVECSAYNEIASTTQTTCVCISPEHVTIGLRNAGLTMMKSSPVPTEEAPGVNFLPKRSKLRTDVLLTADELINGNREEVYGPPDVNFGVIANLWTAMGFRVQSWKGEVRDINATDIALAMTQVKLGRLVTTPDHRDSWVDGLGYLALGAETAIPEHVYLKDVNDITPVIFREYKKATRTKEMIVTCFEDLEQLPFSEIQKHMEVKHPDSTQYIAPSSERV